MFHYNGKSVCILCDGANLDEIRMFAKRDLIDGITTNPTLMKKSGVVDYLNFARAAVRVAGNKKISLEVISDEHDEMYEQAKILSKLGDNVYVKIPIMNTKKDSSTGVIKRLVDEGIKINVTAVMVDAQIDDVVNCSHKDADMYISVFAGRISDTGVDPRICVSYAVEALKEMKRGRVIWASTRHIYNVHEALSVGCHAITIPPAFFSKLDMAGMDLKQLSLETIEMFVRDAQTCGYTL